GVARVAPQALLARPVDRAEVAELEVAARQVAVEVRLRSDREPLAHLLDALVQLALLGEAPQLAQLLGVREQREALLGNLHGALDLAEVDVALRQVDERRRRRSLAGPRLQPLELPPELDALDQVHRITGRAAPCHPRWSTRATCRRWSACRRTCCRRG